MPASSNPLDWGDSLNLYHFQPEAPGAVFWHPRGHAVFRLLEALIRRWMEAEDFQEVRTPQILARSLWEQSSHWDLNRPKFYKIIEPGRSLGVKPVSCPGHIQLLRRMAPTRDELPIRLGEFGICHENDPGGIPDGLFRLCQFTVDDGHVFCREDQVEGEVVKFARSLLDFYAALGFPAVKVLLATRPRARAGDEATWDHAEAVLGAAARSAGLEPVVEEGEGAFYGPRLDFSLKDREGRGWMCGTLQLDLVLPERFDLAYRDVEGNRCRMVMLHRAMVGSLERFLGLLLDQCAGELPPWLAPEQVLISAHGAAGWPGAERVLGEVQAAGLRAGLLDGAKPPDVPWLLALEQDGLVRVQERGGSARVLDLASAIAWMQDQARGPGHRPR